MGKTRVALFLGSALLLWGCGEEASNENGEQEEADELDSYTTEIDMSGENLRGPNDDHGDIYLNMSVKGEFEEGYVEAALPNGQEFSVLYVEDRWFMNEGVRWEEVEFDEEFASESDYHHVLEALLEIESY